ncbi:MAG: hypothetical protein GX446_07020 [Chthonomonadales bacterium]|nr:hypothetical protein [Chthonomonadales bacterium]
MPISEEKLKELAAIEPPKFLERIADFLADLTLRSSSVAVLERAQPVEPIGQAGLSALSLGQRLSERAASVGGHRSIEWLYSLMRPYQIGPYELRQFSMWLVRWHDKLAETEVIRRPADSAEQPPARRSTLAEDGSAPVDLRRTSPRTLRAVAGVSAAGSEIVQVVEPSAGGVRRVRVVRRQAAEPRLEQIPEETPVSSPGKESAATTARREPDVLSRAWRSGHRTEQPPLAAAQEPGVELAPPGARQALTRSLWISNLAMAGAAAGFMMGRSSQTGALVSRIAAPAILGVAGPATTGVMYAPSLAFPLSHPPVSTASWLGAAAPPPTPTEFVPMPGAPIASPMSIITPGQTSGQQGVAMPVVQAVAQQPVLRPGVEAVTSHRGAMRDAFASTRSGGGADQSGTPTGTPQPHPSTASSRPPSPIPGLVAAGLAGFLLGRLTRQGSSRGAVSDDLYVQPVASAGGVQRARVYSRWQPDGVLATMIPPGPGTELARWLPIPSGLPGSRDILPALAGSPAYGRVRPVPSAAAGLSARNVHDPRLGEVTIVAPPLLVASEQSERRGAAVAFDWPSLARGAGELDAAGLKRLQSVLPQGAQAIYPALPKSALPAGAVNLRLAPSLLKPLLTEAYGSQAAGIAGSAAATASGAAFSMPSNMPTLARIVPARRPAGEASGVIAPDSSAPAGALQEAGAGQARRTAMLDFLGVPVRLAPSLGGRPELRDELAVRGVGDQQTTARAIRPHVFNPLRQQLFPGVQTVHAEPDRPAWRRAAPTFGLRDSEPTTVLAPDSRVRKVGADAPLPQVGADRPSGSVHPLSVPAAVVGSGTEGPSPLRRFEPLLQGPLGGSVIGHQPGRTGLGLTGRSVTDVSGPWPQSRVASDVALPSLPTVSTALRDAGSSAGIGLAQRAEEPPFSSRRPRSGTSADPRLLKDAAPLPANLGLSRPLEGHPEGYGDGLDRIATRPTLRAPAPGALDLSAAGGLRTALEASDWSVGLRSAPRVQIPAQPSGQRVAGAALPDRLSPLPEPLTAGVAPRLQIGSAMRTLITKVPSPGDATASRPLPTIADRMGLPALRSAGHSSSVVHIRGGVAGIPVAVPEAVPVPTPILARVGRPGTLPEPAQHQGDRGVVHSEPRQTRFELPSMAAPGLLGVVPVGLGVPIPLPMPGAIEPASSTLAQGTALGDLMPLPVGGMPAPPVPPRASSTVASHAPRRYYAAVDSGPASRNLAVQRAAASAGMAGGPQMPMPSPHRAQRVTADTQRASALASREDGMTANEVHLLANDVWSILRRRLALEADRRGKW